VLHLIGGGGHASVVADVAQRAGHRDITIWSEDEADRARFPAGVEFRSLSDLDAICPVMLAVGDLALRQRFRARFARPAQPLIDPSASVGFKVAIAPGVVVFPGCVINANARIESDAIINTACVVEHDCIVGENSHLSPGVRLGGGVIVGNSVHVGIGGVVLPRVRIGDGAIVGAGAVVIRDVDPGATVVGVPARALAPR
jgi:sugar O-acyltransferase (sialic acid O-acetyltransferase NeuD family)